LEFEPHLFGPYSETIDYILESLIKLGLVKKEGSSYSLTGEGQKLVESLKPKPELINVINDFKSFLNDLSDEEILVFVYASYPQFISESVKWDDLKPKRVSIAVSLLNKGKISFLKAAEIAGMNSVDFDRLLKERGMAWRTLA
jgi:predicted HTH domain antitoxin